MEELYYAPLDIAFIIYGMNLGEREAAKFILDVWEKDNPYILEKYRSNKLKFVLDTYYWMTYLTDKEIIDCEFSEIQKDAQKLGKHLSEDVFINDFSNVDIFFKSVRLRILFGKGHKFVRIKRRSLMKMYGYKRLSPVLLAHFKSSMDFFHLQSYVRGGIEKSIEKIQINEMITFRLEEN